MSIAIVNKKTILVLLLVSIAFIGCDMRAPSSEDLSRLEVLKKKYENDLKFELAEEIYLNVHQKHEAVKVDKDLSNIYKEFFMNGDNLREDSKFIYLNLNGFVATTSRI